MIQVENVSKVFAEGNQAFSALSAVSMEIKEGECVILSGVSGSGKSTLLSLMAGLDRPSSGKIIVDGELVSKLPDMHASAYRAQKVGMIFQHFNLIESLSVEENVIVPLINSGLDMATIKKMAQESMEHAAIDHKSSQDVSSLSGGEKQRCAIARALVHDPKVLFCDEPTANLDRENSLKFIDTIHTLHKLGKTIIIATHDPIFEALPFESRVLHMHDGRIGNSCE